MSGPAASFRIGRAGIWRAAALLFVLPIAADTLDRPVAFTTVGGDAWTFDKRIEAMVSPAACDSVAFTSPRGTVVARPLGGRVSARIPLQPAGNALTAACRKDGHRRGVPAAQTWFVRLQDAPTARIRIAASRSAVTLDASASAGAPVRAVPVIGYEWASDPRNPVPLSGLPARGRRIALQPPGMDGSYSVILRVTDALGRVDESRGLFRVAGGRAGTIDVAREAPDWARHAVVYGVIPSLFGPRGFDDVTARLDDLAALGVTTLWLSPITAAPEDDFGYAVSDHFRLRANFGSEADFRELIAAAHARKLRVIMDFVPNHLSDRHAYSADADARGRASPYFTFFARTPDGDTAHYFDWENLKNLNYGNPEVQRLITEAFVHWVRNFDVDGFRVDVAWGPRQRAPEFWPRLRDELKRIKPDLLLLAEASARDPYYFDRGFEAAYDWTGSLGEWAWRAAFDDQARTAELLRAAIAPSLTSDPSDLVFRFLNNNDTGARFVTRYGQERTRVAAALLLTLPGLPGLYTGEETGAAFEPYDEGAPLAQTDPHGLRAWYARLIALRRETPALRAPALRFVEVAAGPNVLAYLRSTGEQSADVLVLLNFGPASARIALPPDLSRGVWRDLLAGENSAPAATLPAYGVRIFART